MSPRRSLAAAAALAVAATPVAVADARKGKERGSHGHHHGKGHGGAQLPSTIALPDGFQAEGITAKGTTSFAGSRSDGQVLTGDLRTGAVRELVPAQADAPSALGMKLDRRGRLFVAGGATGSVSVYDARSGTQLYRATPAAAPAFVNDVVLLRDKAVFTDSATQRLVVLPIGERGALGSATTVPITGDLVYDADPTTNEANGIVATRDGTAVIVVNSRTGELFRVDPSTGVSTKIAIAGGDVKMGDGLLREGRTLYAMQNRQNKIAVLKLSRDDTSATITGTITDPDFDVPSTITAAKGAIYAINARFGSTPDPATEKKDVVRVDGR